MLKGWPWSVVLTSIMPRLIDGLLIAPQLDETCRKRYKRPVGISWRMDETYIKVKGQWMYLYRAVDNDGKTVDFLLSEKQDELAARAFFEKAIGSNGLPEKVTMDKRGANNA
jgi:putative transposase